MPPHKLETKKKRDLTITKQPILQLCQAQTKGKEVK